MLPCSDKRQREELRPEIIKQGRPSELLYSSSTNIDDCRARMLNGVDDGVLRLGDPLLEQQVDISVIQVLLGHKKLETTALYSQVATATLRVVTSPLDYLKLNTRQP